MLRVYSAPHIGLTTDNLPYLQVSEQHPLAVDTFRRIPGQPYKLDRHGIPTLDRVQIDNKFDRQTDVISFAYAIYDLNEPWKRLITDRAALNYEILQLPHASSNRSTNILDQVGNEVPKLTKPQSNTEPEKEEEKVDLSTLGVSMDKSPEAQAKRAERMARSREWHIYLRIEPYLNTFGTYGLFMPDIGYALSILGSSDNGIQHPRQDVREASIMILSAIANATALKLKTDLDVLGGSDAPTIKSTYAKEALGVMNTILALLYMKSYGVNDRDNKVNRIARELEETVINLSIGIKGLIVPDEGTTKHLIIT